MRCLCRRASFGTPSWCTHADYACSGCCCRCQHAGLPCLSVHGPHRVRAQRIPALPCCRSLTSCTLLCAVLLPGRDRLPDSVLRVPRAGPPAEAAPCARLSGQRAWRLLQLCAPSPGKDPSGLHWLHWCCLQKRVPGGCCTSVTRPNWLSMHQVHMVPVLLLASITEGDFWCRVSCSHVMLF